MELVTMEDTRQKPAADSADKKRKRDAVKEALSKRIPKRGYSPAETAAALGVSLPTINRAIYTGRIASSKIMGRRVISLETIDRLLSPARADTAERDARGVA
jgi:DNA-directed RNA polymerase specialized sigma24 family protein